jgi:hypothetical protein
MWLRGGYANAAQRFAPVSRFPCAMDVPRTTLRVGSCLQVVESPPEACGSSSAARQCVSCSVLAGLTATRCRAGGSLYAYGLERILACNFH